MKFIISLWLVSTSLMADVYQAKPYHWYLGGIVGYGSTTWDALVPTYENQNEAMSISTPIEVYEGGNIWGFMGGYEFLPTFAVEVNYINYPDAQIFFDTASLFSFRNNNKTSFVSQTTVTSVLAKLMMSIPTTPLRAYSAVGVARLHRTDVTLNHTRITPTFGVGLNYPIDKHIIAEIGGNYVAGYGESQIDPSQTYLPFLYSISGRLAYCF